MTEETRRQAILAAMEADKRETHALTIRGERQLLPVISLRISVPLLNPYSHRIRAQLMEDPDYNIVRDDPFSDAAQNVLTRLVQERHRHFAELKASLRAEGQLAPGVITRSGLLVNANTRLVALRDLASPNRTTIRVMVLPPDISNSDPDILEIETSLQVQRELKDPYSLVNELLLIEELARGDDKVGKTSEQIAFLMRYEGANSEINKKRQAAAKQVEENFRLLRMIRHLSSLTDPKLPLTVFDSGESSRERRQPLIEVCRRYDEYLESEGLRIADQYAREWLLAFLAEAGAVHKARLITPGWVDEFVLEELRDDDRFADRTEALINATEINDTTDEGQVKGLSLLDDTNGGEPQNSVVPALLNILAAAKTGNTQITVPGSGAMDAAELKSVMTNAALAAIRSKDRVERDERAAYAPIDHILAARSSVRKATDAYQRVQLNPDFEHNKFNLLLKRLRKDIDALEDRARQGDKAT